MSLNQSNKHRINTKKLLLNFEEINGINNNNKIINLEFRSVGFSGEGKTGVPGEKPLEARTRTNNKLNPHMTPIESGNRTRATLVGGDRSHHCAILALHSNRVRVQ